MSLIAPLPRSLQQRLVQNTHPGLMLDKYAGSWDDQATAAAGKLSERVQKPAIQAVVRLSRQAPAEFDFASLQLRRRRLLATLPATTLACTTTGPLTLHLARASALENAGICLHPIYGFAYLPGSGLKGMARAYAETVWKPGQPDAAAAQADIETAFGNQPGEPKENRQRAGAIVFHEAWPTAWPRLVTDILNNHHATYYRGQEPPGDWDNPIPVYFLAVPAGTTFEFALSKRVPEVDDRFVELARSWLAGALCHLGAGAKTNSGYGSFRPAEGDRPPWASPRHATFEATVELVTPAFLAGAEQTAEDCDLRPATLRGLLRWWWRTMHAGFLDVDTLRHLEAAIWGDTQAGGAVRVEVEPRRLLGPALFNYKDRFDPQPAFKRNHGLADRPDQKTTQGLFYAAYGMDEISHGQPNRRYYLDAGSCWSIRLLCSEARFCTDRPDAQHVSPRKTAHNLSPKQVLYQAAAALWLLTTYGGVGSKSRKGFGSLQVAQCTGDAADRFRQWTQADDCRAIAAELRAHIGLGDSFEMRWAESSALGTAPHLPPPITLDLSWDDPWKVVDEIGFAYQAFAKSKKHDPAKAALGLPRKIHGPRDNRPMGNQKPAEWRPPEWLDFPRRGRATRPQDARHASPVHIHVVRSASGTYAVRAIAFPAAYLPDLNTSRAFLQEFLAFFVDKLRERAAQPTPRAPREGARGAPRRSAGRGGPPRSEAAPPGARVPTITPDELKQQLSQVQPPRAIMRAQSAQGAGTYAAQRLRLASIAAGYQGDGGWRITGAPPDLPEGTIVLAEAQGREGRFLQILGRLTPPPAPRRPDGPRRR
mgnify:CR=1 FL=1